MWKSLHWSDQTPLNDRLREHKHTCQLITAPSNLAAHCKQCECSPLLERTLVIGKAETITGREIWEAFAIPKERGQCISTPSVMLTEAEIEFNGCNWTLWFWLSRYHMTYQCVPPPPFLLCRLPCFLTKITSLRFVRLRPSLLHNLFATVKLGTT